MKILALLIPILLFVSCSDEEIQQAVATAENNQETILEGSDSDGDGAIDSEDCAVNDNTKWQAVTGFKDNDNDTYGVNGSATQLCLGESLSLPEGFSNKEGDCNDDSFTIKPFVAEILGDEIDNNCDGGIDNYPAGPLGDQSALIITEFYDRRTETNNLEEWIEIYNPSDYTIDMTNMKVTDDYHRAKSEIFENVLLPPKSYLVIGQENAYQAQVKYKRYNRASIIGSNRELILKKPDNSTIVDIVSTSNSEPGYSHQLDFESLKDFPDTIWCNVPILQASAGRENYSCDG